MIQLGKIKEYMNVLLKNFKLNKLASGSRVALVAISLLFVLMLSACIDKTVNTYVVPQATLDSFFQTLITGEVNQAYEDLFKAPLIPNGPDEYEKIRRGKNVLKTQARDNLRIYGAPVSFEYIKSQPMGSKTVRMLYMLHQEKKPTLWEFVYYEVDKHWYLVDMMQNERPKAYAGIIGSND